MYDKNPNINPLTLIFLLFQITFLAIFIPIIINNFKTPEVTPKIKIDNLSSYTKNLPEENRENIFAELYRIVALNTNKNTNLKNSGAKIRQNTFVSKESKDSFYGKFIVDLEEVQQSYLVQYEYNTSGDLSGYPLMISCPTESEMIYENSKSCRSFENL